MSAFRAGSPNSFRPRITKASASEPKEVAQISETGNIVKKDKRHEDNIRRPYLFCQMRNRDITESSAVIISHDTRIRTGAHSLRHGSSPTETKTYGMRSQKRIRMSLTSSSRRAGEKVLTTPKNFALGRRSRLLPGRFSFENEPLKCHRQQTQQNAAEKRVFDSAVQPNRVINQPPIKGPNIIGTRRTMD